MQYVRIIGLLSGLIFLFTLTHSQENLSLKIVASFSVLSDVVGQVVGDTAEVKTLIGVGQDPHTYIPLTADLVNLSEADVIFTNGAYFEEGLLESIENIQTNAPIYEVSACVPILPFVDLHDDDHDVEHSEDHGDEHADDHADDHGTSTDIELLSVLCNAYFDELGFDRAEFTDHTLGLLYELDCEGHGSDAHGESCDPHVWLNPRNVMLWTLYIRDILIEFNPSYETRYRANAQAYIAQLQELIDEIQPAIDSLPVENRILVTNHEALGYFASAYDFELVDAVLRGGSTSAEPSAAELAELIGKIRETNVTALFAETTVNSALIETVGAETGLEVYALYTGSLGDAQSPASTYINYFRYNVSVIVQALGGTVDF